MSDDSSPVALALEHVESGDLARARHCLEAESDSEAVAGAYAQLTRILYNRNKDVSGMLALGRAGIDYQLREAERVAAEHAARSVRLRASARILAFNVAANCWPGWGDDGVVIAAAHVEEGLRLARLSLELVQALDLGPHQRGNAYWLVGALALAAGRLDEAIARFDQARACSLAGGERLEMLLAEGYRAIALDTAAAGQETDVGLEEVVRQLDEEGSDKAKFFSGQLQTAARILPDWK